MNIHGVTWRIKSGKISTIGSDTSEFQIIVYTYVGIEYDIIEINQYASFIDNYIHGY